MNRSKMPRRLRWKKLNQNLKHLQRFCLHSKKRLKKEQLRILLFSNEKSEHCVEWKKLPNVRQKNMIHRNVLTR